MQQQRGGSAAFDVVLVIFKFEHLRGRLFVPSTHTRRAVCSSATVTRSWLWFVVLRVSSVDGHTERIFAAVNHSQQVSVLLVILC